MKLIENSVDTVVDYLQRFEVHINPKLLGIDEELFIYCMQHATKMRSNRYTYLHEVDLSTDRLKQIYKELISEL
ncbi:hypothetical protein RLG25_07765 [Streptococcus pneumoniae]|nr:hypothetical protein [Streptococcus pneumoniae]